MGFDKENEIIKLCVQGLEQEGKGFGAQALELYTQAWRQATNDLEKFTAAHYIARHQQNVQCKLDWDLTALQHALKIDSDTDVQGSLPSLYLNVAKCYEDLSDHSTAKEHYMLALAHANKLTADDGYSAMIKRGIVKGLERIGAH